MKHILRNSLLGLSLLSALILPPSTCFAQGTAFTYQGRLSENGAPANGSNDLRFVLFDAPTNGNQISTNLTFDDVQLAQGIFTVTLDWGAGVFDGGERWLEIRVRPGNAGGPFDTLSPRQRLAATPFALHAGTASNLLGSVSAGQLPATVSLLGNNIDSTEIVNGTIMNVDIAADANIADTKLATINEPGKVANSATTATSANTPNAIVARDASGNFSAGTITGSFSGSGAGLTNIGLSTISSAWMVSAVTNVFGRLAFDSGTTLPTGNGPGSVKTADFNGDGRLDFIVAGASMQVQILTNNGTGQYVESDANGSATDVAVGDFNRDGRMDYAATGVGIAQVYVWTNSGHGHCELASQTAIVTNGSGIVSALLNSDAHLDLAMANPSGGVVTILTNNGAGIFVVASTTAVGVGPGRLVAGHVNTDGRVDLVVLNSISDDATVLLNSGSGLFSSNRTYAVGDLPLEVTLADVNGDNRQDMITANWFSHTVGVWTNSGGVFALSTNLPLANPSTVAAADFNLDGRVDLVAADFLHETITVFTNSPGGHFAAAQTFGVGQNPRSLGVADLNLDGFLDFYAANFDEDSITYFLQVLPNIYTATVQLQLNSPSLAVSNNVTVGGFNIITQTTAAPANNATLTPASGYVKFANTSAVSLNATTAIANGVAVGATLILEGGSDANTVTVPNNANTRLGAQRTLGIRDTLTLLWNGLNWLELSYANN